jgi:hypothetical protein
MAIQDKITQIWVKAAGRKIDPKDFAWLIGPIGNTDIIKDKFIYELAEKENLEIQRDLPNSGLLERMEQIGISDQDKIRLNSKVADFYENTSNYDFEVWSEWKGILVLYDFVWVDLKSMVLIEAKRLLIWF